MADVVETLCGRLTDLLEKNQSTSRRRILIAFAGTPGSGKSTISAALTKAFSLKKMGNIAVLPMDGFHYPTSVLAGFQDPEYALQRRGAPFTFDADAFLDLARALRETPVTDYDDPDQSFYAPSFDHAIKDPVERDIYISSAQRIVILEGNYLLLDEAPWNQIQDLIDESWFVSVSRAIAKQRLIKRHLLAGIETSVEAAAARAENNDLLNGDLITKKMIAPDLIVEGVHFKQVT